MLLKSAQATKASATISVSNSIVRSGASTHNVTAPNPPIDAATSRSLRAASVGSRPSTAAISSFSPSGSRNPIVGREKRLNGPSTSTPRSASRTIQPSRDFAGAANATVSTMPLPLAAAASRHERKERENRARMSRLVSVIEMIGAGIVEVDRVLDQSKADNLRVEVDICLRIDGDRRHVVNAANSLNHGVHLGCSPSNAG